MTSNSPPATSRLQRGDSAGFTLVEVVIVTALMGMIAAVLAAAFVVVARTNPANEARADDARALLSLTNMLSQDVASTTEGGFVVGESAPTLCTNVPQSLGLLRLTWGNQVAYYRWLSTGPETGRIVRYSCTVSGPADSRYLTTDLDEAPPSAGGLAPAPVEITLTPTQNGNPGYGGVEFLLNVYEKDVKRELLRLDASTRNVQTALPSVGGSGGSGAGANNRPTGQDVDLDISRRQTLVYSPVLIDDIDNDALFITLDDSVLPNNWGAATLTYSTNQSECTPVMPTDPGCWRFSVTAPNSVAVGDSYDLVYRVCDRAVGNPTRECSPFHRIRLNVTEPTPTPPVAAPFTIDAQAGQPVNDVLMPIADAGGLADVSVSFETPTPNGWSPGAALDTIGPTTGIYLSFATNTTDPAGTYTMRYQASDGVSSTGWVDITVVVTAAPVDNPPTAGSVTATVAAASTNSISLPVTDEQPSTLTYEFRGLPNGWAPPTVSAGGVMSLRPPASAIGAQSFQYRVRDSGGQYNSSGNPQGWVDIAVTVTNQAPVAAATSSNASKGVAVTIELPVSDAEETLEPAQVSVNVPNQWTQTVSQSGSRILATITPSSSANGLNQITYRVTDSAGQQTSSTISITVCSVSSVTFQPPTNVVNSTNNLASTQRVAIATNGACGSLVALFNPSSFVNNNNNPDTCTPTGQQSAWRSIEFNGAAWIDIPGSAYTWQRPASNQTRYFCFLVRQGQSGPNERGGLLAVTR